MSHFTNDPDPLGHTRDERGDDDGDAAGGVPVMTCWRCTHPATCIENGFCSIERCDLDALS